ncbi:two-component response regulator ARR14-like [Solanum lycopersicum]|uniref:two-component response regulator ARR14-like n=1 Tax=Solanum lycopersicum TaxID=4081 RepID=UPI00374A83BC
MEEQNNQFFEIIRCLLVDVDDSCLLITATFLKKSKFEVVTVKSAKDALGVLRSSGLSFELVVTEVHMPEINGFQLQQEIAKKFNIPVAFYSVDEKESTIIKGLESGVILFMGKPISQNDIIFLWKYAAMRKKIYKGKQVINQQNQDDANERIPHEVIHIESSSPDSERDKSARKSEENKSEHSSSPPSKKTRIVWTDPLHNKFVDVVSKLGMKEAHPRKILDRMDTPELTRIHVASHLQKYRMDLKKDSRVQQLMPENSNVVDHVIETDHQDFHSCQREKELARILCRHINKMSHNIGLGEASIELSTLQQSYEITGNGGTGTTTDDFVMLDNVYSTELTSIISGSQLNVQSSNMQENYEGITTEKSPFNLCNVLPNSEPEQENFISIETEDRPLHLHNVSLNSEFQKQKGPASSSSSSPASRN